MKLHVYCDMYYGSTILVAGDTEKERLENLANYMKEWDIDGLPKDRYNRQDASIIDVGSGQKVFEIDIS